MYKLVNSNHEIVKYIDYYYVNVDNLCGFDKKIDIAYFNTPLNSTTSFVEEKYLNNIFYFNCDKGCWTIHYSKKITLDQQHDDIQDFLKNIFSNFISSNNFSESNSYFGVIVSPEIYILNVINEKNCSVISDYVNTANNMIDFATLKKYSLYFPTKNCNIDTYSGLVIPTNTGLVVLNSQNHIKFFKNFFTRTNLLRNLLISDFNHLDTIAIKFVKKIDNVKNNDSAKGYSDIFELFSINDTEYHANRSELFKIGCCNIFDTVKKLLEENNLNKIKQFLIHFMTTIRKKFTIELFIVFWRLKHYPEERQKVLKMYGNHPYIVLLSILNSYRKERFCSQKIVADFIFQGMSINSDFWNILLNAIKYRSDLFEYMYQLYLETEKKRDKSKKFKYEIGTEYFPFKIYNNYLFVMENVLRNCDAT